MTQALVDAAVRCVICKSQLGECSCWVTMRCAACGNTKTVERHDSDPPGTVVVLTNECPRCNAASGGFGHVDYFDKHGNQLEPGGGE